MYTSKYLQEASMNSGNPPPDIPQKKKISKFSPEAPLKSWDYSPVCFACAVRFIAKSVVDKQCGFFTELL